MKRTFSLGAATFTAVLIAACSAGVEPTPGASSDPTSSPVFRTAVRVHADGTQSAVTSIVPRDDANADAAARARFLQDRAAGGQSQAAADAAAPSNASCKPGDIWIYDGDGSGGTCPPPHRNEICFSFDPNATNGATDATYPLDAYPRCTLMVCAQSCVCYEYGTWESSVGAYWPGASAGFIEGLQHGPPYDTFASFNAWGACTTAVQDPNPLQNASFLALAPPP
jgi:hypothetical protein